MTLTSVRHDRQLSVAPRVGGARLRGRWRAQRRPAPVLRDRGDEQPLDREGEAEVIYKAFRQFDKDGDGQITTAEFIAVLKTEASLRNGASHLLNEVLPEHVSAGRRPPRDRDRGVA